MRVVKRTGWLTVVVAGALVFAMAGCEPSDMNGGNGNGNANGNVNGNGNVNDNGVDNGNGNDNGVDNGNVNDNGGGPGVSASAGADQTAEGGDVVQLDGNASTGGATGALSYLWQQTTGTAVDLAGEDTATPSFTAPNTDETLTFQLTVSDETGAGETDTVDVVVTSRPSTLFVVNNGSPMTSYGDANNLDGEIAPTTRLNLGAATSLFQPRSIVVTREGRLLLSRQNGGIAGYDNALTADGDTPADIVVEGNNSLLESPISFAYDATNDRLYVGDISADQGILVFDNVSSADFDGDVAPDRTFGPGDRVPFGSDTSISMTVDAMDLDSNGYLFVSDTSGLNVNRSRILVFWDPGSADGLTEPDQVLTSSFWGGIEDLVVDANDVLYLVDQSALVCMLDDVSTLAGEVSPRSMTVQGTLISLQGIVVASDGTGFLADQGNHRVYTFEDLASLAGTLPPDRTLDGFETRLSTPRQMFLLEP